MKIGFIGMGNMAKAIAAGFINSGKVKKEDLFAYAPTLSKLEANAKEIGFTPVTSAKELANASDVIIMACKPYQIESVLSDIKSELSGKAVVSIAAGWLFDNYHNILGDDVRIQATMPNTPAMVSEGVILFEQKNSLNIDEKEIIIDYFKALGIVEIIPGELMGIGGAVSGCGPAFMDLIIEAYADAAVKYGISRDLAYRLVSQTMLGSAKLQQATGKHPGVLKDEVCSPRGTTIRGVAALEENGLRNACIKSIDSIMDYKNIK